VADEAAAAIEPAAAAAAAAEAVEFSPVERDGFKATVRAAVRDSKGVETAAETVTVDFSDESPLGQLVARMQAEKNPGAAMFAAKLAIKRAGLDDWAKAKATQGLREKQAAASAVEG
jgi:hypothetical protein